MRSEQEMLDLILGMARADRRIRGVILNGSRANPNVPRDIFQDYDIVYLVSAVDGFVDDRAWIARFGKLIIMQTPDDMDRRWSSGEKFTYLMLFEDGNRIDLTFYPIGQLAQLAPDSLSIALLDKDGILGTFPPPSDEDYITKAPTEREFAHCCNEFWWVSTYIAKGLWRRELPYAKYMQDQPVRNAFTKMVQWYIGVQTGFAKDSGKCGKYFERYLSHDDWATYLNTYPDADYGYMWDAVFAMSGLFRKAAMNVANAMGYVYPSADDERVSAYLQHVRTLPPDAERVYS